MLKVIEIRKYNGLIKDIDLTILIDELKLYLNNKEYSIDNKFIEELVRIIRTWKSNDDSKIIDDNHLELVINKQEYINIKGILPDNYIYLTELLKEFN